MFICSLILLRIRDDVIVRSTGGLRRSLAMLRSSLVARLQSWLCADAYAFGALPAMSAGCV